jgi:hypothetical protein
MDVDVKDGLKAHLCRRAQDGAGEVIQRVRTLVTKIFQRFLILAGRIQGVLRSFIDAAARRVLSRSPAIVAVGGLNEVNVFRTDDFSRVATISVGSLPHGIWPSGDHSRVYVGLENADAMTATGRSGRYITSPAILRASRICSRQAGSMTTRVTLQPSTSSVSGVPKRTVLSGFFPAARQSSRAIASSLAASVIESSLRVRTGGNTRACGKGFPAGWWTNA